MRTVRDGRNHARLRAAAGHLREAAAAIRRGVRILDGTTGDAPAWPPLDEDGGFGEAEVLEALVRGAKRRDEVARPPASRRGLPALQRAGFQFLERRAHEKAARLVETMGLERGGALGAVYLSVVRGATPAEVEAAAGRVARVEARKAVSVTTLDAVAA